MHCVCKIVNIFLSKFHKYILENIVWFRPCPHVSVFVWKRNFFLSVFKKTHVHTRTGKRRFPKVPLWRPSSKSSVFGDRFIIYMWMEGQSVKKSCVFKNIRIRVDVALSLFSSHRKNWFAARCECLHLIKKNSQCLFSRCEVFLIRCKYSQRSANQFLR